MNCVEIISVLKDILLSACAVTGAFVAVKGLNTWRRQLRGQSEYDLSRRILVSLLGTEMPSTGSGTPQYGLMRCHRRRTSKPRT